MRIIKAVPTNIITGSLGVGKTTIIQQLLKNKPTDERWAVLVNEFGEIGIDGTLLASAFNQPNNPVTTAQSVFIREVPGGCMCCASGLPMQIALNQLLASAKPHRLLIEPTGLGHPKELIEILSGEHYKDVISLHTILCLADARKIGNKKWRSHQTFQDQFEIADVIVATKSELYDDSNMPQLLQYLQEIAVTNVPVQVSSNREINIDTLNVLSQVNHIKPKHIKAGNIVARTSLFQSRPTSSSQHSTIQKSAKATSKATTKATNNGDGFYSCGWVWPAQYWFDYDDILQVLNELDMTRIKGVIITTRGIFGFNGQAGELDIREYDEALESRLELIADSQSGASQASDAIEALVPV